MNATKRSHIRRAMKIVAKRRICPACLRLNAMLKTVDPRVLRQCRWCAYQQVTEAEGGKRT